MSNSKSTKTTNTTKIVKETAKKPEVKEVKKEKPVIDLKTIKLPSDINMKVCKTCAIFTKGDRKSALKGRLLEMTAIVKELESTEGYETLTAKKIQECHLGSMKAIITGISDNKALESILTKFFKAAKKIEPKVITKTAKETKKAIPLAVTPAANDTHLAIEAQAA